ncbi:MAG: hypothetical protein IPL32_03435 [Chloracidobacterium sp.]|nr:hypothetical protein [Chloracidobacterium sp.]
MSWFNRGQNDKAQGSGQADPNKFKNDTARKDYQAGYDKQKQEQQQQQKQQQNNKK